MHQFTCQLWNIYIEAGSFTKLEHWIQATKNTPFRNGFCRWCPVLVDLTVKTGKAVCRHYSSCLWPAWLSRATYVLQQTFEKFCSLEYWCILNLQLFAEYTRSRHGRAPTMWWPDALSKVLNFWRKVAWKQCIVIFRALKQLRAIDDKIIYALNVSTPTASMQVEHDKRFRGNPKEWVKHIAFQNERMGPLNQCFRFLLLDD